MSQSSAARAVDFTTYYWREARWAAALFFAFVAANYLVSFSYREWLLDLDDPAPWTVWFFEWGLIIPAALVAATLRVLAADSRAARFATLACIAAIALGVTGDRWAWVSRGEIFFNELNCFFFVGVTVMSGIESRRIAAIALPVLLIEIVLSYRLYGWGPLANFEFLSFATGGYVMFLAGWQVEKAMRHAWGEGRYYETLAQRDALTGLLNRRGFEERAEQLLTQAAAGNASVGLAVVDLDQFKPYNDCYGHPAGDRALITFAQVLTRFARRPMDLAARIGGEEFVLLWCDADEETVRTRAESVVEALLELALPHERAPGGVLTTSLGAHLLHARDRKALDLLMQMADANLYAAKQRGGNCAIVTAEAARTVIRPREPAAGPGVGSPATGTQRRG